MSAIVVAGSQAYNQVIADATALASKNDYNAVRDLIKERIKPNEQDQAFLGISEEFLKKGLNTRALACAQHIKNPQLHDTMILKIVKIHENTRQYVMAKQAAIRLFNKTEAMAVVRRIDGK